MVVVIPGGSFINYTLRKIIIILFKVRKVRNCYAGLIKRRFSSFLEKIEKVRTLREIFLKIFLGLNRGGIDPGRCGDRIAP